MSRIFRTDTRSVAGNWAMNQGATNSTGQFSTDGQNIYSYSLLIGTTNEHGQKIARDYTSGTNYGFQSMTTSKHVGYARMHADFVDDGAFLHNMRKG